MTAKFWQRLKDENDKDIADIYVISLKDSELNSLEMWPEIERRRFGVALPKAPIHHSALVAIQHNDGHTQLRPVHTVLKGSDTVFQIKTSILDEVDSSFTIGALFAKHGIELMAE